MNKLFNAPLAEDIAKYRQSPKLSQSTLKYFLSPSGVKKYTEQKLKGILPSELELYYEEKETLVVGSGADDLFTLGIDFFNSKYLISETKVPGDKVKSICHHVLSMVRERNFEIVPTLDAYTSLIEESALEHEFQPNYKPETKIKKILEDGSEYFSDLVFGLGKTVIDAETYTKIFNVAQGYQKGLENLIYGQFSSAHTIAELIEKGQIKIFCQVHLEDDFYKGLLDLVVVIVPISAVFVVELKSTSFEENMYLEVMKKFRYDLQIGLYAHLTKKAFSNEVNTVFDNNLHSFLQESSFSHFPVIDSYIIMCNVDTPLTPHIFHMFNSERISYQTDMDFIFKGTPPYVAAIFSHEEDPETGLNFTREVKISAVKGLDYLRQQFIQYEAEFENLVELEKAFYLLKETSFRECPVSDIHFRRF